MSPFFKSFLAPKILMPQLSRYYTLLRFSVYISFFVSIAQIIILLPKPGGLAYLPAVSINSRVTGVYMPVLKSSIDLAIWVLAPVLNNVPFYLISD